MLLKKIQNCFSLGKVLYTRHARDEMEAEEFGQIKEHEVYEAISNGKIIESYPDDEPYPSFLVFGKTSKNRPIHILCAYAEEPNRGIIITVYQPHPEVWEEFERRKR